MKCVGGHYDGKHYALKPTQRRLDIVVMPKMSSLGDYNWNNTEPVDSMIQHVTYSVRRITVAPGRFLEYLAPSDWSDEQAITHQFEK